MPQADRQEALVPAPESPRDERINQLESALADALIKLEKVQAREPAESPLADMPADAETGSCYGKLLVPAQYVDRSEQRIIKEASERLELIPAKMIWVDEQVLVSEEHVLLKVVPATYKWVKERTEVLPQRHKQILVAPAKFKTVVEQVLETPEDTEWRVGRGEVEKIDEKTGQIMYRATIAATYRNITKQVLVEPARYRTEVLPAVYETMSKKVVDVPEHTIEVVEPAVYKTVKVQRVVEPERQQRHVIPAQYKTFHYREKVADARLDWHKIPCETQLTTALIRDLQHALKHAGYDAGYADGILGDKTLAAIEAYQRENGFATGRLSMEVLEHLGVGQSRGVVVR